MSQWLNYHHLYYFWTAARHGSVSQACKELRLSQPAMSAQLKELEATLGHPLFDRHARGLCLTEFGQVAKRYADEIFALGNEFLRVVDGSEAVPVRSLHIGIADVIPKIIAYAVIQPIMNAAQGAAVHCHEDKSEVLASALALHQLDVILSDEPLDSSSAIRAFSHFLGAGGISFLAEKSLAQRYRRKFPKSLDGAPLLLPSRASAVRRRIDLWLADLEVSPKISMEFQDSALMKIFGKNGLGIFPVPTAVERDVRRDFKLETVGRTEAVKDTFYLISLERKVKHPLISLMIQEAKNGLFV